MKKTFMKKRVCLAAAALTLTAGVSAGSAMAYFTTYATAAGSAQISLGSTTITPHDEVKAMEKHIAVENTGDFDCFVRVKVLAGDKYKEGLEFSKDSEGLWSYGEDGYYYYSEILPAKKGEKSVSSTFKIKINDMGSEDDFNVIVVQECTPVIYDQDGNAQSPDWNRVIKQGEKEAGES